MERAQKMMFLALMGKDTIDPSIAPDVMVVIRDIEVNDLIPIRPECEIRLQLSIRKVRAAGLVVGVEFRSVDLATLYAKATWTICRIDAQTHQPTTWSDEFRAKHEALLC